MYEPESFVPLAQYVTAQPVAGIQTPVWQEGEPYVPEKDPLQRVPERQFDAHLFYYHCDQIGTPLLMTDEVGEVVWEASYRAWGEAREVIARASKSAGVEPRNPMRFQGQQEDAETGLRYNRHRYYDPVLGRFVSKDPIGLTGGLNAYQYAPNPVQWTDPQGMCSSTLNRNLGGVTRDNMQAHHLIPEEIWNKHQLFFDKIGMGGERDKKEGGLLMPDSADKAKQMKRKFYHCGPHAVYFAAVGAKVTDIKTDFNAGRIDKSTARQKISQLQSASRLALMAPGSNPIRIFLEKSWNITH